MKIKYHLMLLCAAIIWGLGFVNVKIALQENIGIYFISASRFLIASIMLSLVIGKKFTQVKKSTCIHGIFLGVLFFLAFTLQTAGLQYTSVANNSFITALYVIVVPFLYWILYQKRPKFTHFLAAIISLLGVQLLNQNVDYTFNLGDFLSFLCAGVFALHMIFLGRFTQDNSPVVLSFLQLSVASLLSFVFFFAFEDIPKISVRALIAILYLGAISSFIAFTLQNIGQKYLSQISASLVLSTEAIFASTFSILLLGEPLNRFIVLGGILIFIAIFLAEMKLAYPKKFSNTQLPKLGHTTHE